MTKNRLSDLADHIRQKGKQSCRTLAEIFETSKSSVHRCQQKIEKRSNIPAASFFESTQGRQFLLRVVVATIFVFGIMGGVGAKRIALFLSITNIDSFVAVSTSSVFRIENQIEELIIKYKEMYDTKIMNMASDLEITPGADETFFDNLMLLVLMDLNSGFIFVEKPAVKRDHKTWEHCSLSWLSKFKIVRCFVSDKARALLKLAKDSLGVIRIPDLFHMMNDVCSVMRFPFNRQRKSTEKSVASAQKLIDKGVEVSKNKVLLVESQDKLRALTIGQGIYQRHLRRLSILLHPFSILSSIPKSSAVVESEMQSSLCKIKTIKTKFEIPDYKKKLIGLSVKYQTPQSK